MTAPARAPWRGREHQTRGRLRATRCTEVSPAVVVVHTRRRNGIGRRPPSVKLQALVESSSVVGEHIPQLVHTLADAAAVSSSAPQPSGPINALAGGLESFLKILQRQLHSAGVENSAGISIIAVRIIEETREKAHDERERERERQRSAVCLCVRQFDHLQIKDALEDNKNDT